MSIENPRSDKPKDAVVPGSIAHILQQEDLVLAKAKQDLDAYVAAVTARLNEQKKAHFLKIFKALEEDARRSEERLRKNFEDSLKKAESMDDDYMRGKLIESIKETFEISLKGNRKLIEDFIAKFAK